MFEWSFVLASKNEPARKPPGLWIAQSVEPRADAPDSEPARSEPQL